MADREELLSLAGPILGGYLDDPQVTDIAANDNETCFVRRLGQGKKQVVHPGFEVLDGFLGLVAHEVGTAWSSQAPRLSAALEDIGWRLQATRFPACPTNWMALRKHPKHVFPLEQLQDDGILSGAQYDVLTQALRAGKRLVIGGGVGSAKTSLLNSCLHYLRTTTRRVFIAEDDPEILCTITDRARMWSIKGSFGLREMVQDSLRSDLDLLIIGELRGGEALELLKAFRTGHGGMTTVHVDTMEEVPERLEELVLEVAVTPMQRTIGSVIDLLVHMERTPASWRCTGIGEMHGWCKREERYDIRRVA